MLYHLYAQFSMAHWCDEVVYRTCHGCAHRNNVGVKYRRTEASSACRTCIVTDRSKFKHKASNKRVSPLPACPVADCVAIRVQDGFDLDVAYVTKRIIVHGVPNVSADPLYDDPRTEVRRLLDKYHHDRYKAYTFASELAQMTPPTPVVDARVERYLCTYPHSPCP